MYNSSSNLKPIVNSKNQLSIIHHNTAPRLNHHDRTLIAQPS